MATLQYRKRAFLTSLLKNLGHEVPSDEKLEEAVKVGYDKIKTAEEIDKQNTKLRFALEPVSKDWVKRTF